MVRTTRPTRTAARPSFTLLELLVVIGIILALVSLSVAGIMKGLNYQQRRNTETGISKLDQALQKQWLRVIDMAKNETPSSTEMTLAGGDPRRAQVIHIKLRLVQMFPATFKEATSPPLLPPNQAYVRALASVGPRPGPAADAWKHESSACLYMILKQSIRGGDFDPDTSLSSQEVRDPVGDGVKEIFDGWGNPIIFSRFPYNPAAFLNVMNTPKGPGNGPPWGVVQAAPPSNDPVDPESLLADPTWVAASGAAFTASIHTVFANKNYNLRPLIVSMGSDGFLYDPLSNIDPATGQKILKNDDIYNLQLTP